MKVRIEIEWSRMIQIVGVGRAKGLARAADRAVILSNDICLGCDTQYNEVNAPTPWEKKDER